MKKIIVVDFGSQYNQVIIKSLRKLNVYAELINYKDIKKHIDNAGGIILSGGPKSVYEEDAYQLDIKIEDINVPVLGVCYGMQYLAHIDGGKVEQGTVKEFGQTELIITKDDPFFNNVAKKTSVWMSHNDNVVETGPNYEIIAETNNCVAAIKHKTKPIYGVQYHIEVEHTLVGKEMLYNFVFDICQMDKEFYLVNYIEEIKNNIKKVVGEDHVICALSGGVDSSVVAKLLSIVIPKQVHFFYVDTGLMRLGETDELVKEFVEKHELDVKVIDGSEVMFKALKDLKDPEEKRKAIGSAFIKLFEASLKEFGDKKIKYLAQGTLYSDIIESGTITSHKIKSHHNVGGLPDNMELKVLEPIKFLFKEEVREVGTILGMNSKIINRQPFPGPGLGIRIMGEVTDEKVQILKKADAILRKHLDVVSEEFKLWQYFCVLTNTKSVGVKGDKRAYEYVLAIRAVNSIDAMTANFAYIDFAILDKISQDITNQVEGITRVVYDITSKPPGTIEWE